MDQSVKVAGTEGKVGGYFCRLLPLNENTVLTYVLDAQKSSLIETVLLSTHNMFWLRNMKINFLLYVLLTKS